MEDKRFATAYDFSIGSRTNCPFCGKEVGSLKVPKRGRCPNCKNYFYITNAYTHPNGKLNDEYIHAVEEEFRHDPSNFDRNAPKPMPMKLRSGRLVWKTNG